MNKNDLKVFVNEKVYVEFTPRRTVSGVLRESDGSFFVKLGVKFLPVDESMKVTLV
jgi:small nuclear ribonucleoprotein (snRNP)-like protein